MPKHKSKSRSKQVHRNNSNSKQTWERFLKNKDSVDALKKSWKAKNPQQYYEKTIIKLAKKYNSSPNKRK